MFATAAPERRVALAGALTLLLLALAAWPGSARALLPPPESPEAWLVTYGPGEVYWQRFGHNAIWLREPGGLDHTFNFGFFDFEQENFLLRFVQGRMLYFAAAIPADREMALYAQEGREIRVQRLDLSTEAYARLRAHLVRHVRPENREYLYDYYRDNCSTRVRDALDLALDGALGRSFLGRPAAQDFRAHTRRSTESDYDYHLGLVTALGLPVDRPIDRWAEMFLPAVLADAVAEMGQGGATGGALVTEDRVLLPARTGPPPALPGRTWPRQLLLALVLVALGATAARFLRPAVADGLAFAWIAIAGTLGLGLALVWAFTDHVMAYPNLNLLLLNPLWLLALIPSLRRLAAGLLLAGGIGALVAAAWPGGQYLADTLALFLPLNLAAAWRLRSRPGNAPPAAAPAAPGAGGR